MHTTNVEITKHRVVFQESPFTDKSHFATSPFNAVQTNRPLAKGNLRVGSQVYFEVVLERFDSRTKRDKPLKHTGHSFRRLGRQPTAKLSAEDRVQVEKDRAFATEDAWRQNDVSVGWATAVHPPFKRVGEYDSDFSIGISACSRRAPAVLRPVAAMLHCRATAAVVRRVAASIAALSCCN